MLFMPKTAMNAISKAFEKLSAIGRLKAEVDLLTSYSGDAVYRLRYDTMQYDYISPAVINLLGYTAEELMQTSLRSLIIETRIVGDGMKIVDSYEGLEENRKRGDVQKWQADYLMRTKDGRKIWVSDVSHPWFDKKGAIIGSKGSLRDITDRIEAEQKLHNEMFKHDYTDELTGLANTRTFWVRLEEELKRTQRAQDTMSLMLLQINKLDAVRKHYDDKMAEDIIISIGLLLRSSMREIDIIARVEGGTFAVIMPDTPTYGASAAAKRVVRIVTEDNYLAAPQGEENIAITLSAGLASSSIKEDIGAKELFKIAESQLYATQKQEENKTVSV